MKKIKITLIMGPFLPVPALQGGAVEKLWFDLCKSLVGPEISITLISKKHSSLLNNEIVDGVRFLRIKGYKSVNTNFKRLSLDLIYSMRAVRAAKDSDLIITNTFWAPVFAKLLTNSKVWVSAHRFPKKQYFLYKNVDLIQPVSKSVAKGICQQTPSVCELVKVLPNFIKSEGQNPKLTDKKKTILFVGRVHPEKGVEHLIKAFSEIPNHIKDGWQLKIIGPFLESQGGGGEDYLSTLKKLAAADIKFTGPIFNKDQLNNEYLRASVFVYPSVSDGEAFGLAPIEALAFGCQTIVSDLDCFDDYLIHGKNGYKCNLNNSIKSELSDTLIKVIQQHSTDSHQTLINNSCKTAQNFDLKIVSKLFAEQIKSLVNENS